MIDHNLALDPEFSPGVFCETHVFAADLPSTFSDFDLREGYRNRLGEAAAALQVGWDNVPEDWHYVDQERTLPTLYPIQAIRDLLARAQGGDFWNTSP